MADPTDFVFDSTGDADTVLAEMRDVINAIDQESAVVTRKIWEFYGYIQSMINGLDDTTVAGTVSIDPDDGAFVINGLSVNVAPE